MQGKHYTLISSAGSGSALIEAALEIAQVPYVLNEIKYDLALQGDPVISQHNPLSEIPTLLIPDGTVLTESAAMILHLSEGPNGTRLLPPPHDPQRARALRWLIYFVANIYPTYNYGDDPSNWVKDPLAQSELRKSTDKRRAELWSFAELACDPEPWWLGQTFSALDIYVGVMSRWRTGRLTFNKAYPKLSTIAAAADSHPQLSKIWDRNFTDL